MFFLRDEILSNEEFLSTLERTMHQFTIVGTRNRCKYYNVPASFDIETSSFLDQSSGLKCSLMYEWTFGINGLVTVGRTWDEYKELISNVEYTLGLTENLRLIVYVHNLSYEFQFMRKIFDWDKVFSLDVRKPVYAITTTGTEYRCSYKLSGYNLATIGKNLQKYKVEKMVGDLDYSKVRHSGTPLTEREWGYCVHDVLVVMAYIQEKIESDGNIAKIPLTKTGYVRQFCRENCFYQFKSHNKWTSKYKKYHSLMKSLTLTPGEYNQLKRAFQGGFTHANACYARKTLENVGSFDFTSSYPYVMISEKFPMGPPEHITIKSAEDFEYSMDLYCCMFDVEFTNISSITSVDHPISYSKCSNIVHPVLDNGRIVCADSLCTTITDCDWETYKHFYTWEDAKIYNFVRFRKGYLPTDFVKSILKLYQDKTTLKGVAGKEVEYLGSKEMVNAAYGMTVTDICRDEIDYESSRLDSGWNKARPNLETAIEKYNNSSQRFLYYPWGVWVTAYARRNLFSGIYACGDDYVYSDTDSIKVLNPEKHMDYINSYNEIVVDKLNDAMKYHGLPESAYKPKTIKGEEKCLGLWDNEGVYTRFKTLGAKRYMTEKDGVISITVSGLNKFKAVPYLLEKYGDNIFDAFDDGLYIEPEYTGKNTLTYIDDEQEGIVTDYLGVQEEFHTPSGINMEPADYSLTLTNEYIKFIMGVTEYEY